MNIVLEQVSRSAPAVPPAAGERLIATCDVAAFAATRRRTLALLLLAATAPAQTVVFGSVNPTTLNAIPWGLTGGCTSLHVYPASMLRLWGACAGAQLLDFAVAAGSGGSGTFLAPQCTLAIGHLTVQPPVPGAWTNHLAMPAIVHTVAAGPFTFAWSQGSWNSLPGVAAAGFVWDGDRDIGVVVSTSPGTTGTFATGTSSGVRHHTPVFAATTQSPTVLNGYAMAARLTFAPGGPCATATQVGTGCHDGAYSFYQQFADVAAFDLQGSVASPRTLVANPVPAGFQVADGVSAWFAPTGAPVLDNGAVPGPMQDDSLSAPLVLPFAFAFPGGSTTVVHAASNGFVLLGASAATTSSTTPNTGALASGAPRLAPLWCDLDPAFNLPTNPGAGIYFDVAPGNQAVYVTWREVAVRGLFVQPGQSSVSVQCVLHANGSFEWRYGAITAPSFPLLSGPVLVGWSQGNAQGGSARILSAIDISSALPLQTNGPDSWRLGLDSSLPILGTSLTLTVVNVPNIVPLAFLVFGDTQLAAVPLGALGAPECFAYTNANLLWTSLPVALGGGSGGTGSLSIALPNVPGLVGMPLTSQALAFTYNNPLGVATSNGLTLQLGR
ncbi:MAG: hypothetical protein WAT39_07670 [Planctomycetota bacterium]